MAVLARDGLALHLATHAAQHGPDNLKALADLARGLERWHGRGLALGGAARRPSWTARPPSPPGCGCSQPAPSLRDELGLPPTDELDWAIRNRDARPRGTFHLQALARARGCESALDVLRRSLLPTREWITGEYPVGQRGSRARLVAAYGAHLLRAPVWAARAWRYRRRERRAGR